MRSSVSVTARRRTLVLIPDHPNNPAFDPEPRCEWDAVGEPECDRLVYDDNDLCEEHMSQAMDEDAADTARKIQKEDEIT